MALAWLCQVREIRPRPKVQKQAPSFVRKVVAGSSLNDPVPKPFLRKALVSIAKALIELLLATVPNLQNLQSSHRKLHERSRVPCPGLGALALYQPNSLTTSEDLHIGHHGKNTASS